MIIIETGTDELLCRIEERVAVITLNKPHKKNALGDKLTPALRQILPVIEADDRVGAVMVTGAGDAFCSGGDVSGMGGASGSAKTFAVRVEELTQKQVALTQKLHELNKITVAALPGAAAGAGASIALACDLRVASSKGFITTAFKNVGLSGDYGASWFLPRLIGLARAKELFYSADRVNAEDGLRLGIFNQVFPEKSFFEDAFNYAKKIADGPTATLGLMKKNLHAGMDQSLGATLRLEAEHMISNIGADESREAISAFMAKRKPKFHKD